MFKQKIEMMDDNVKSALDAAVSALYFNDNSDYETALYEIVCYLLNIQSEDFDEEEIKEIFKILNP